MKAEKTEFEKGRQGSMIFGGLVYSGVVIAATTLFISFVLLAFPQDAYFSRFVMVIGGLLIGASMIAFPFALHNWAVGGTHRLVTIGLYYGEMAIIAVNTIVAFASMLAKYSGYVVPEWMKLYEPFTILSIVYTLAAWGTVFQLDPIAKAKNRDHEAEQRFKEMVSKKKMEFLDSVQGEDAVIQVAMADIQEQFNPERHSKAKKNFGSAKGIPAPAPFVQNQATAEKPNLGESFRPDGN